MQSITPKRVQVDSRGFTLIELLVVIAIIGILSSVVLASLNSARAKGADSSIKSNVNNARTQAEIYFDDNGNSYMPSGSFTTGPCPAAAGSGNVFVNPQMVAALTAANTASGGNSTGGTLSNTRCGVSVSNYAVSVKLKTDALKAWCIDNAGAAKVVTTLSWSGQACPAS